MGKRKLNDIDKESCERAVTCTEWHNALSSMKSGKSTGYDGLTVDFYRKFWPILGPILVDALNYSFIKGELSESQKGELSRCFRKGGKIHYSLRIGDQCHWLM